MEPTPSQSNLSNNYVWYWKANQQTFSKQGPGWIPYDIVVNQEIENNFEKENKIFDIKIGDDIYVVNLDENIQFLKNNTSKRCFIIRASGNDDIIVFRKNRFAGVIDASFFNNSLITNYDSQNNLQERIKVNALFGEPKENLPNSLIFHSNLQLFNVEICISTSIHKELKDKLFNKVNFNNAEDIIRYIEKEISEEARRLTEKQNETNTTSDPSASARINFNDQANTYLSLIQKQHKKLSLEELLIHLFTAEGFLFNSINSVLRDLTFSSSKLPLYYTLLKASIEVVSKKYNPKYSQKSLQIIDEEEYYVLYQAAQISEDILNNDIKTLENKSGIFRVYNEFLSLTYDKESAFKYLFKEDLIENHVSVFYKYLIPKEIADKTPNLFSFVEEISWIPHEKGCLLSSSTIFQVKKIEPKTENNGSYNEITSLFISNGFNRYDFLKYTSLQEIELDSNQLGAEGARWIAEALRINTSLQHIRLGSNGIGDEGAKSIAEALKINNSLQQIELFYNRIGPEGARSIAEALKINTSLKNIGLDSNGIRDEGAISIAEALRINNSLLKIELYSNQIGDEGATSIAEALKINSSLQYIGLSDNQIGSVGARSIAEVITINTSLHDIGLSSNHIGDEGARSIAEALNMNTSLQRIGLCSNQISAEGAKSIAEALRINTSLQKIRLGTNRIGDEGAKLIAEALRINTSLQKIWLSMNQIGDEGARLISEALRVNTSLQKVRLYSNQIGDEVKNLLDNDERIYY